MLPKIFDRVAKASQVQAVKSIFRMHCQYSRTSVKFTKVRILQSCKTFINIKYNLQIILRRYKGLSLWDALKEFLERKTKKWSIKWFPKVYTNYLFELTLWILFYIYSGNTTRNIWRAVQKNCWTFSKETPHHWQQGNHVCQNLFLKISPKFEQTFDWSSNNKIHFVKKWLFQRYPKSDRSKIFPFLCKYLKNCR